MLVPVFTKTGSNTYSLTLSVDAASLPDGYDSYDLGIQFDPTQVQIDTTSYVFSGGLTQVNTDAIASGTLVAASISLSKVPSATPLVTLNFTDLSKAFMLISIDKLSVNGVEYALSTNVQTLSTVATVGSTITGSSNGDLLVPAAGNDTINAGAGIDTLSYSAASANFSVYAASGSKAVVTNKLTGEADTFVDGERIQFSDSSVALDIASSNSAGGIYRLYKAALGRAPDLGGLGYWIAQADAGTKDAVQMATDFTYADEFKTLYSVKTIDNYMTGEDITALVTSIYQNVLNRTPDDAGRDYYVNQITAQTKTVGRVLAEISDSAENYAQVAGLIAAGVDYIPWVA